MATHSKQEMSKWYISIGLFFWLLVLLSAGESCGKEKTTIDSSGFGTECTSESEELYINDNGECCEDNGNFWLALLIYGSIGTPFIYLGILAFQKEEDDFWK